MGNRNRPFYRVVVSDSRKVPTADAVEEIGHYDPAGEPGAASINVERAEHWIANGAQVSPAVAKLLDHQKRQSA
jgi:small subunit ribosomal protein S16